MHVLTDAASSACDVSSLMVLSSLAADESASFSAMLRISPLSMPMVSAALACSWAASCLVDARADCAVDSCSMSLLSSCSRI